MNKRLPARFAVALLASFATVAVAYADPAETPIKGSWTPCTEHETADKPPAPASAVATVPAPPKPARAKSSGPGHCKRPYALAQCSV